MIKILLVDDDLKNSMLLKRFLEVEGYNVTYAGNGNMGWELLILIILTWFFLISTCLE